MGYQLWASPITGYRRTGTRLSELRSLLGSGITAHAILEPLQSCPADASAPEMAEVLDQRDFDVAGVQLCQEGRVVGIVTKESLKAGVVKDHVRPITADLLVSDSTSLPAVLSVLKERQHTFVLIGSDVRGIITRADLNKPPVRVYLFGLVSLLEMHLSFWITAEYRQESWQRILKPNRLEAANKLLDDRRARNHEARLLDCVQFCDKRDLVVAVDDLREKLNLGSRKVARRMLTRAENLRNVLSHSQQDLVQGTSWEETIPLVEWVEAVLGASDALVEYQAKSSATRGEDGLWASV